jgi:hypothetical protein
MGEIAREVMPFEVNGDIEYGLSKVDDGWWLYLINNQGVIKFTNKEQSIDMSKTAKVRVLLKNIKTNEVVELREEKPVPVDKERNSFEIKVNPGDIRILKIKTKR